MFPVPSQEVDGVVDVGESGGSLPARLHLALSAGYLDKPWILDSDLNEVLDALAQNPNC